MRILHTSDWHLGRSFHGASTVPQLREVLLAIPGIVRQRAIDTVVVAGDVFDHAAPAAELYELLAEVIRGIREAGAVVVITSGNHDSAARLGFQSEWAAMGGVHVMTRADAFRTPLTLRDGAGDVDFYGIPYLEPMLQRDLFPGERFRAHGELLTRVLGEIDELRARRARRSVVVSHCFAVSGGGRDDALGADELGADLVWDLTAGGLDLVPAEIFAGADYAALGHLHGRGSPLPNVRYSGAPLHFSFSEAAKPRGGWIVDLDADGLAEVQWCPFPVPRPLVRLRGTIDALLDDAAFREHERSWVEAVLSDRVRPIDAMRRLRERFPHCAHIEFDPEGGSGPEKRSYASRVSRRSDVDVVDEFLRHVRSGETLDDGERTLVREAIAEAGNADESRRERRSG